MDKEKLRDAIPNTMAELDLPDSIPVVKGKVRDIFDLGNYLLIVTTDRISAFDIVLSTIPYKGEVLNRISLFWFKNTNDIIKNHIAEEVTPRAVLVKKCKVIPIEVVVRGYLTGSAWRDYKAGRDVSGIQLDRGMAFNEKFREPIVTPSTKSERGIHDEPVSEQALVERGIVSQKLWEQIKDTALKLFARGTDIAAENGLILVDTKYEFGLLDNGLNEELVLVDEIHTPDSSRYWYVDTYEKLFKAGEKQNKLDKEYLRQWLMEHGFMGEGKVPDIPDEIKAEVAWRYIKAYETITGEIFVPLSKDPEEEKRVITEKISFWRNTYNG